MDPTTAIADMALVNDINGVCNNRETRVITPIPINVASMNTNNMSARLEPVCASVPPAAGSAANRGAAASAIHTHTTMDFLLMNFYSSPIYEIIAHTLRISAVFAVHLTLQYYLRFEYLPMRGALCP